MTDAGQAAMPFAMLLLGMLGVYIVVGAVHTWLEAERAHRRRQQYHDATRAPTTGARITLVPKPKPYDWADEPPFDRSH